MAGDRAETSDLALFRGRNHNLLVIAGTSRTSRTCSNKQTTKHCCFPHPNNTLHPAPEIFDGFHVPGKDNHFCWRTKFNRLPTRASRFPNVAASRKSRKPLPLKITQQCALNVEIEAGNSLRSAKADTPYINQGGRPGLASGGTEDGVPYLLSGWLLTLWLGTPVFASSDALVSEVSETLFDTLMEI